VDRVQDKPNHRTVNNRKIWSRNPRYASDAVVNADYLCEFASQHNHFVSKFSQRNYVEAHHLIPMKFQEQFDCSLDIMQTLYLSVWCVIKNSIMECLKIRNQYLISFFRKDKKGLTHLSSVQLETTCHYHTL
jgi:hypothetical protein